MPPIPDEWRTNWHLAGHMDQLNDGDALEVTVAGTSLRVTEEASGLIARSADRKYPVMVVDDEIFVLLGDEPE